MAADSHKIRPHQVDETPTRSKLTNLLLLFKKHDDLEIDDIIQAEYGEDHFGGHVYGDGNGEHDPSSMDNNDDLQHNNDQARPEYWYDKIEDTVEENEERSVNNSNVIRRLQFKLDTVDYRTVWVMRILTGVLFAIIADMIIKTFPSVL